MRMSLGWHQECLKNQRAGLARHMADFERMTAEIEQMKRSVALYGRQIEAAEKQGKDGFDRERFLQPKKGG